jgi:hypothetical protein
MIMAKHRIICTILIARGHGWTKVSSWLLCSM